MSTAASSASQNLQTVVHAAEEFVDKMNPTQDDHDEAAEAATREGEGDGKPTLEERKKKLEELRKRMVSEETPTIIHEHWLTACSL